MRRNATLMKFLFFFFSKREENAVLDSAHTQTNCEGRGRTFVCCLCADGKKKKKKKRMLSFELKPLPSFFHFSSFFFYANFLCFPNPMYTVSCFS